VSYRLLSATFQVRGLSSPQFNVLRALAHHMNEETGQCNPGIKLLGQECGLSDTAVKEAIAALETVGYVEVSRAGRGGKLHSNRYHLRLDQVLTADQVAAALQPRREASQRSRQSRQTTTVEAVSRPRSEPGDGYGQSRETAPNREVLNREENIEGRTSGEPQSGVPLEDLAAADCNAMMAFAKSLAGFQPAHASDEPQSGGARTPIRPRQSSADFVDSVGAIAKEGMPSDGWPTKAVGGRAGMDSATAVKRQCGEDGPPEEPRWVGEAASIDDDGWGLDSDGHPLRPVAAATEEVMDAHYKAKQRWSAAKPPGTGPRLITADSLRSWRQRAASAPGMSR